MKNIHMRYPEGKTKAVTFSYDDRVPSDERFAKFLAERGMKCTFNFTANETYFTSEQVQEIFFKNGHEIATHGAEHRCNGHLRPIEGIQEVLNCRLSLEKLCGRIIRGMAYAYSGITQFGNFGTYEQVKQYLTELDIAYSRTLGENKSFKLPNDFHAWVPTLHHNHPELFDWIEEFLAVNVGESYPRLFYIWGHTFEFENDKNWDRIEKACDAFMKSDDIWYATNIEIYDYIQAYKSLVYSADNSLVYNPSLIKMWIACDGVIIAIEPSETKRIK